MNKFLTSILIASFIIAACSSSKVKIAEIKIKGSDTMLPLIEKLAEKYMEGNPGISIFSSGGGSAKGIIALLNNEIDICTSSRTLEPEETKLMAEKFGSVGFSTFIARDAVCIYVNKNNSVTNFSIPQLKDIFTGRIKNWIELGGNSLLISPVIRDWISGTAAHFKVRVLEGTDYDAGVIVKSTVEDLLEVIEDNENAIGFSGLGYQSDCVIASIEGFLPTAENIKRGSYPLSRYLYLYTISTPSGAVKDFIDWVLSPEGQSIVKQSGFISLFEISY
ncbi:MAG: phosphate ABC transporter substrate-binding protein [bacterium]